VAENRKSQRPGTLNPSRWRGRGEREIYRGGNTRKVAQWLCCLLFAFCFCAVVYPPSAAGQGARVSGTWVRSKRANEGQGRAVTRWVAYSRRWKVGNSRTWRSRGSGEERGSGEAGVRLVVASQCVGVLAFGVLWCPHGRSAEALTLCCFDSLFRTIGGNAVSPRDGEIGKGHNFEGDWNSFHVHPMTESKPSLAEERVIWGYHRDFEEKGNPNRLLRCRSHMLSFDVCSRKTIS
jgi:hypothetical protein